MKQLLTPIKEGLAGLLFTLLWLISLAIPISGTYLILRWVGILG